MTAPPPGYQPPYGGADSPDPYYAAFYARAAPRPGCVPLRPLGLGDILDGAFSVIRRNPRTILGLSVLVAVVQASLTAVLQIALLRQIGSLNSRGSIQTDTQALSALGSELSSLAGVLVIGAVLGAVLTGLLTVVITEDVLGVRIPIDQAWARTRPLFWRLLGLSLLVAFVQDVTLFVGVGVWLWGIWAVAVPAMMVERIGVFAGMRRSRALVSGTFWRVWGIRALGFLIVGFVTNLISLPFAFVALSVSGTGLGSLLDGSSTTLPTSYVLITALGSVLSLTFTAPVRAAIDALLYVDLRMRKEGMDIVLQQHFAQRAAP